MNENRGLSMIADNSDAAAASQDMVEGQNASAPASHSETIHAIRRHLPDERGAINHHFSIAGQEGCITVGVYEDGSPSEMFVRMAKERLTVSGLMDAFATVVSLALRSSEDGVPTEPRPATGSALVG